jgi:hypothetical protein
MQAMGFDVQWENDNVANFNGYGKTLVLNVSQMSLIDVDSSHNLITPAPGSRNYYCQAASKDIILDDNTVKSIMTLLGIDIRIDVDTSQTAVYIYTTADLSSSALPANVHTEYDGFYITLRSASEEFVSVTWHNNTDSENITFGEYYHVEIYKNGTWERVPCKADTEIIIRDIAYALPANGGQKKMSFSLSHLDMSEPGTYRVRCEFYDNGNKFSTWVEFEMNN